MEFDEVAVEELFKELADVLLDDVWGGVVLGGQGVNEGGEGGGLSEQAPDFGAGIPEAEALAGLEGHQDDFGADGGFGGVGAADEGDGFGDAGRGHEV